jgi:NAD(P)-dependent dehydrogenase (short-subunit alcohol dehydrogenase family)
MMAAAAEYLGGRLDIVINNAGYSGSFQVGCSIDQSWSG